MPNIDRYIIIILFNGTCSHSRIWLQSKVSNIYCLYYTHLHICVWGVTKMLSSVNNYSNRYETRTLPKSRMTLMLFRGFRRPPQAKLEPLDEEIEDFSDWLLASRVFKAKLIYTSFHYLLYGRNFLTADLLLCFGSEPNRGLGPDVQESDWGKTKPQFETLSLLEGEYTWFGSDPNRHNEFIVKGVLRCQLTLAKDFGKSISVNLCVFVSLHFF